MKKAIVIAVAALGAWTALATETPSPATPAQPVWLTVAGNAEDPAANTIQVDPAPVEVKEGMRIMRVRVSRSTQRTSWDGVPYRSYESTVLFDCTQNNARYLSLTFFMEPGWKGRSHKTSTYPRETPRWMEFRDVQPNPNLRIQRAACLGISR